MSDRRFRGIEFDSQLERDHYLILLDDKGYDLIEQLEELKKKVKTC